MTPTTWYVIVNIACSACTAIVIPLRVGQPRKPITATEAFIVVALNVALVTWGLAVIR